MMSENKQTVEQYIDGFRRTDHAAILACLTDDVEWWIPGFFRAAGKEAFDRQIENEGFIGKPEITTTRLTEENDVVITEGTVRTQKATGEFVNIAFCDVFEMQEGRIRRLISYLMQV